MRIVFAAFIHFIVGNAHENTIFETHNSQQQGASVFLHTSFFTLFCITDFFPAYADSDGHLCKIKEHGISITIPGSYTPLERGYSPSELDALGLSVTYGDYFSAFSDQDLYVDAIRSVPYAEILLHVNDGTGLTSFSSMSQADLRRQASDIVKELEAAGWETLSTSNFTSGPLQYIVLEYSGGGFRFLLYMTVFQEKIVSLRYQTGLTQAISSSELAEIQGIVRSISFSALQNKAVLVTVSITLVMLLICFVLIDGIKKSVHPRPDSVNDEHDGEEPKQSGLHGVGRLLQKKFNTQWFLP